MNDLDLHWLAGLLEGEGCFYLTFRHNKDGTPRPLVSVVLTMTDEDVVRRAHEIVGSGNVHTRAPKQEHWKTSWTWNDSNVETVGPLLRQLRPLMGQRRGRKIDDMLTAIEGWVRKPVATHGSRTMYVKGCRCAPCKAAHAAYMRRFKASRREVALLDDLAEVSSQV